MNSPHYLNFPANLSFVDALAGHLLKGAGEDPLALARTLVLLPTRRSCRSLREAFLRQTAGKPLLLPRIMPIGEIDGEADIAALTHDMETTSALMPEKRRLAMLTRLIMQGEKTSPARSYQLAVELARLQDEVTRNGLSFAKLHDLVPLELAAHWQKTMEFLSLITRQWPRILAEENKIDAASFQRERTLALAEYWKTSPPDFPVIAAGSTGSIPATAELLMTIAAMPGGTVILPGFDEGLSDEAWEYLDPTHPQYGLKQLLEKAETKITSHQPPTANHSLTTLFAPALLTAHWRKATPDLEKDFSHIALMQADTQAISARMIAYTLREALETPGKTAALVTPDRTLARMVAAECARYGIAIDDSAGTPLGESPAAIFMQLLLEVAESGGAPHALLALLRHPFTAAGTSAAKTREYSRLIEKHFLRGVRLTAGMDALADVVKAAHISDELTAFVQHLRDIIRPLEIVFLQRERQPLAELLRIHAEVAIALASGEEALFAKEAGVALSELLLAWRGEAETLGDISAFDYPPLFAALLSSSVVRKSYGTHPRLHILSPLEARLLHFDLVILGEMNEGTWPASIAPDPWMSAPMREQFGLPAHAAHIGQSAHDVWMLLHAPQVILTRSAKIFGAPAKPSRWWVRLTTLVAGHDEALLKRMDISARMQATVEKQDAAYDMQPLVRPQPTPPLSARPRNFSPSSINLWSSEPYAFYAQKILRLRALDPLDAEPDSREFGELIHSALEHFSADYPDALPEHSYQLLIEHGQRVFQDYLNRPAVMSLWWPRFEAIARNFLALEQSLRMERYRTQSEVEAVWKFTLAEHDVTFSTRADRVDAMADGFRLIDYKTGTPPSAKSVLEGKAKQLPLTALALMRSGAAQGNPETLVYWALKTRAKNKDYVAIDATSALLSRTESELMAMIEESLTQPTSYTPDYSSARPEEQDDYAHLTRRNEWGN